MFLTALNVAGMSALIGIVIASAPSVWVLSVGFLLLSACVALGLGVLRSANLQQFPSPEEIVDSVRDVGTSRKNWLGVISQQSGMQANGPMTHCGFEFAPFARCC